MSTPALLLVILAAFCHATWNLAAKRASSARHFVWMYSTGAVVIYLPVVWYTWNGLGEHPLRALAALVLTGILHLAYGISLQMGYRAGDLSVVYPVARGTGPLVSSTLAILVLGEALSFYGAAGALLIVAGILVLTGGRSLLSGNVPRQGIAWGVGIGMLIAAYTLNDGWAVKVLGVSPWLVDFAGNIFRVIVLGPSAFQNRIELRREVQLFWKHALAVAVLGSLGYILVLYAMRTAPISHVAPAREISMLVGAFYGARFLNEGDAKRRLAAALLIAVGVGLLMQAR